MVETGTTGVESTRLKEDNEVTRPQRKGRPDTTGKLLIPSF